MTWISRGAKGFLHVEVFVGTSSTSLVSAATTAFNSPVSFNVDLGTLQAGDKVHVAVGAGATDLRDTFAPRYQITAVPEPSPFALMTTGVLGGLAAGFEAGDGNGVTKPVARAERRGRLLRLFGAVARRHRTGQPGRAPLHLAKIGQE